MSFVFMPRTCPFCRRRLSYNPSTGGMGFRCPYCGKVIPYTPESNLPRLPHRRKQPIPIPKAPWEGSFPNLEFPWGQKPSPRERW